MSTVPDDLLKQVQEAGRERRRLSKADRQRQFLAGIVDTGSLDDDQVAQLWAAFKVARGDDDVITTRPV